ncbi:DUF2334 domain-containing protein [Coraliomargarita sinensis]|uniref:DUF2334 domain-containing protein n=1 Tax=Coraliomargarita sinensis TaxID=2174842 RepID=A0A317ZHY5_9BACT|nr:polysaccharide deacetylase family protein [Coraliomargarita sinensis]PXA02971.1 DUF2334 domain-containing protein [Coraliomargarita sinensis]
MKALVSIHDVMPHTMDRVERILDWLKAHGVPPVTLLVVPGRPWEPQQIDRLRQLAHQGYQLAAHGWHHETKPRHAYHRIHAALISRNVAEHLDLNSKGILQLMQRSRAWFGENTLPLPDIYVPPAWALGPISKDDLAQVPYRLIETTRGLIHLEGDAPSLPHSGEQSAIPKGHQAERKRTFQKLPLTGYEADTTFRQFFLRCWNANQARAAKWKGRALRISIHPDDLDLLVADQLASQIDSVERFEPYLFE